jgi:hypothetical protein
VTRAPTSPRRANVGAARAVPASWHDARRGQQQKHGLHWVAVSTGSSPFAAIFLDDATATATSTAGRIWAFPRSAPQQVTITRDPAFPW